PASSGGFDPNVASMSTGSGTPDPHGLAIADLDNDGRMDVVVANYSAGNVVVFAQGPAARQFRPITVTPGSASAAGVGDFNGDGLPDLAVANGSTPGSVAILRQR